MLQFYELSESLHAVFSHRNGYVTSLRLVDSKNRRALYLGVHLHRYLYSGGEPFPLLPRLKRANESEVLLCWLWFVVSYVAL